MTRPPMNRRILEFVAVVSVLSVAATLFLTKLWAAHSAQQGKNSALAGAILGGL